MKALKIRNRPRVPCSFVPSELVRGLMKFPRPQAGLAIIDIYDGDAEFN